MSFCQKEITTRIDTEATYTGLKEMAEATKVTIPELISAICDLYFESMKLNAEKPLIIVPN